MRQVQRWAEVQFQNTNKLGFIIKLSSCYIPPVTKIELKRHCLRISGRGGTWGSSDLAANYRTQRL